MLLVRDIRTATIASHESHQLRRRHRCWIVTVQNVLHSLLDDRIQLGVRQNVESFIAMAARTCSPTTRGLKPTFFNSAATRSRMAFAAGSVCGAEASANSAGRLRSEYIDVSVDKTRAQDRWRCHIIAEFLGSLQSLLDTASWFVVSRDREAPKPDSGRSGGTSWRMSFSFGGSNTTTCRPGRSRHLISAVLWPACGVPQSGGCRVLDVTK
jgi:hypothetical protein